MTRGSAAPRFLGLDLAWKADNPSGAVTLEGARFPLRLSDAPRVLAGHAEALAWVGAQAAGHAAVVGIDAPLLGLRSGGGRRGCDDEISRAFGRFHASTHSPPRTPDLRRWVAALTMRYGRAAFAADATPGPARPALREVFPHAFQVRLFGLDRVPGARIAKYKRRRFATKAAWARDGLGPFVARCTAAIGGRYVADGPAWRALVAERPHAALGGRALKAIEDRWDALLCALAVAVERLEPGTMRFYPQRAADGAAILAPVLPCPPGATGGRRP